MHTLKKALWLIRTDYYRYTGREASLFTMCLYRWRNHCFNYTFWLRLAACSNLFVSLPARLMLRRQSYRHGIQISRMCKIGYGFYIAHGVSIVINPTTVIGNNCNISQCMTIGSNHKHAATIGNNVYIGPNVCIVEDVKIGDNVTIGAGSVVVKDIPANATAVGAPARPVSTDNPAQYIRNPFPG